MSIFTKLLFFLSSNERKKAAFLLILISIMAFFDMIGLASILPFMAVLTNPGLIETNVILQTTFEYLSFVGVENENDFLFSLGVMVFILLMVSLIIKAFVNYAQIRFIEMLEFSLGKQLVEGYLRQPYSWFLNRHSIDLGKNILSEVNQIISNGITPIIELIANTILAIAIITLLLIVDIKITLIVSISLGVAYGLIFYIVRKLLNRGFFELKNIAFKFRIANEG